MQNLSYFRPWISFATRELAHLILVLCIYQCIKYVNGETCIMHLWHVLSITLNCIFFTIQCNYPSPYWYQALPLFNVLLVGCIPLHQVLVSQRVYELTIKILWNCMLFSLQKQWSDQVTILYMSWQLSCHDMYKFVTWFNHQNHNHIKKKICELSVISSLTLVKWVPDHCSVSFYLSMHTWYHH